MSEEDEPAGDATSMPEGMPETANRLLRTQGRAQLATLLARENQHAALSADRAAWPFVSMVTVAVPFEGATIVPLLLISNLAEHTRNLRASPRLSLLFEDPDIGSEPLSSPRLSLVGLAEPSHDEEHKRFFIDRHPTAALYADFSDFAVWTVRWERAHLVAGFGRIRWLTRQEISLTQG